MSHELLVGESSCNVIAGAAEEYGRQLSEWLDMDQDQSVEVWYHYQVPSHCDEMLLLILPCSRSRREDVVW